MQVDDYNAADNSAKSYNLAVHALRLEGLREGRFKPLDLAEQLIASGKAKDYRHIGPHTLYLGDCRDVLSTLGQVDAVVTSPPYDAVRDYGVKGSAPMEIIAELSARISVGGVLVWNVNDQTVDGSETGSSFRQALAFMESGLRLHDTMIYCKEGVTFPDANRYHPAFEYMFVFSRGAPSIFNGIRDWKNKYAGTSVHGTRREADGSLSRPSGMGKDVPAYGLRRNWWVMSNVSGEGTQHPAQMPYRMASDHIETWTCSDQTVLDPFAGSGTTGVACQRLGRRFIGIEIEPTYFLVACRRLEQAMLQPDLFIETPTRAVQTAFELEPQK